MTCRISSNPGSLTNCKPHQKSAQQFSCFAEYSTQMSQKNAKVTQNMPDHTQQSEKYIITNSCLLVLVDNLNIATNSAVLDKPCDAFLQIQWCGWPPENKVKVTESGTIGHGFLLVFYSNFVPKTHRFWHIWLVTIQWPWKPGYGSLKVIRTNMCRYATYDFLLTFHSNHETIWHRFRDKCGQKIAK